MAETLHDLTDPRLKKYARWVRPVSSDGYAWEHSLANGSWRQFYITAVATYVFKLWGNVELTITLDKVTLGPPTRDWLDRYQAALETLHYTGDIEEEVYYQEGEA